MLTRPRSVSLFCLLAAGALVAAACSAADGGASDTAASAMGEAQAAQSDAEVALADSQAAAAKAREAQAAADTAAAAAALAQATAEGNQEAVAAAEADLAAAQAAAEEARADAAAAQAEADDARAAAEAAAAAAAAAPEPPPQPEPAPSTDDEDDADSAETEPAPAPAPQPVGGGTLRIGALSSPIDTLNPATVTGHLEIAVLQHVHDSLMLLLDGEITNQLAESFEPNADATEWTITVVEGATFHDGRPVTAADVAYSISLLASSPAYAMSYGFVDLAGMAVVDDRTVRIPLFTPRADFPEATFAQVSVVVPDGFEDWGANIGSGPYRLVSYEAGVGATLERNPDYWGGAPFFERLEFIGIADAGARFSALRSGEIDYASGISPAQAATIAEDSDVEARAASSGNSIMRTFALNTNVTPFDNPDVVRAVKLAVDRRALIDVILLGNGVIGNDMPSKGLAGYNDSVPQIQRDVDAARELFAGAGVDSFTLRAADFVPGLVDSAELFAQHMAEAGVTVTVEEADPITYFNDFMAVFSTPAQTMYYINQPPAVHMAIHSGSMAPINLTGYASPAFDAGMADLQATLDADERTRKAEELVAMLHDEDGLVIWAFEPQLDGSIKGLEGVSLIQGSPYFASSSLN